jgi:hypothetical protein
MIDYKQRVLIKKDTVSFCSCEEFIPRGRENRA